MPSLTKWAVLIGFVLACAFLGIVMHRADPSALIDAKVYFAAARVFVHGGNPYDGPAVIRESLAIDPTGVQAGTANERYINLPAALLPAMVAWFVPWRFFVVLCLLVFAFCLPLIVIQTSELFGLKLTPARLVAGSAMLAAFAPVWRGIMTGQFAVILLAVSLALCLAVVKGKRGPTALLTFLAITKATCCIPLLCYLFFKARRPERIAIVAACAAFGVVCIGMSAIIGPHATVDGLRQSQAVMFDPGGANDPYGPAKFARVDLAPILALIVDADHISLANVIAGALLIMPAMALLILGRSRPVDAAEVCAWLMVALLVFYHRRYDVAFAAPILALGMRDLDEGLRGRAFARIAPFLLCYALLGDHSLMSVLHFDTTWIRPALTILLYLCCVLPALATARQPLTVDAGEPAVV